MGQAVEEPMTEPMTANVAQTRADLSRNVDALYDRISPGRIVERRKRAMGHRLSSLRDSVMGSAHDVGTAAQTATHTVQSATASATASATDTVSQATQGAVQRVAREADGAPLAAGLVAFGAGMVVAALVPTSSAEEAAAQRLAETVKASPVLDEAKASAQDVGQHLKDAASQAAEEMRGSVQDSAAAIKDEAQSATETVKTRLTDDGRTPDELADEMSAESFPSSDPPSTWAGTDG